MPQSVVMPTRASSSFQQGLAAQQKMKKAKSRNAHKGFILFSTTVKGSLRKWQVGVVMPTRASSSFQRELIALGLTADQVS